jgi:hypothetical protein
VARAWEAATVSEVVVQQQSNLLGLSCYGSSSDRDVVDLHVGELRAAEAVR